MALKKPRIPDHRIPVFPGHPGYVPPGLERGSRPVGQPDYGIPTPLPGQPGYVPPGVEKKKPPPAPPRGPKPRAGRDRLNPKQLRRAQRLTLGRALAELTNALTDSGLDHEDSKRFAGLLLSRPGVNITKDGGVRYKGKRYTASAFATSQLADFVSGRSAERQNRAAIEGDPGYLAALSALELERDLATSGLDDRRRRAVLDFGDAGFAGADSLLGAEASANPFSTSRLLSQAYARDQSTMRQGASRMGTIFGGGGRAGQAAASRQNAARQTEATRGLQDLLAGLEDSRTGIMRGFETTRGGALQEATQRLMSSGQIHAARAPTLTVGGFRFWNRPKKTLGANLFKGLL